MAEGGRKEVSRLKSNVEEPPVFQREWIDQVKEMIQYNKSMANAGVIPRVATPLLNVKPEFYIPQFVSLGPYHHWRLQKDTGASSEGGIYEFREIKMSTSEMYKVKSAAMVSQKLRDEGRSFFDIVERIKGMQLDIESFYDWPISGKGELYSQDFAMMMAVDSSFLLGFLLGLFPGPGSLISDDGMLTTLSTFLVCIKCDILKLENQIPLSVLKEVFDNGRLRFIHDDFNRVLHNTYTELCPFDQGIVMNYEARINQIRQREQHLLGCMHALVSPFLQMKYVGMDNVPNRTLCEKARHFLGDVLTTVCGIFITHPSKRSGQRDFLNAYNARELEKAGIKFKSFSNPREEIRFDKYSDTLYLPRIRVSHIHTEVFLRNMLALEFNDPARRNTVTRYVGLMDCLIDTQDDVRVLMDSRVIRRPSLMLTDEYIAKMWDGMCQPFFTGHLEPPEELKEALEEELIMKYYKSKIKSILREFYSEYLSRPWKIIAMFIGTGVLATTVIDAYCQFNTCNKSAQTPME